MSGKVTRPAGEREAALEKAAVLAEAGLDVLVLESGPHVDHRSYPSDPLEGLPLLYRDGGMTIASGKPVRPSVQTNRMSLTPRFRSSVITLVQKRAPSVFSICSRKTAGSRPRSILRLSPAC